jgi:hypothetical protein
MRFPFETHFHVGLFPLGASTSAKFYETCIEVSVMSGEDGWKAKEEYENKILAVYLERQQEELTTRSEENFCNRYCVQGRRGGVIGGCLSSIVHI